MSKAHDPWAGVETLYELVTPSAIRMAYLMTGDQGSAEDAVHDAFIKVVSKHKNLADVQGVKAYLHRAVMNEVGMHRRSWLRRLKRQEKYYRLNDSTPAGAEHTVVQRDELVAALAQLPLTQRTVLVLTYFMDFSDAEITAATGIARGTIKSARHRGLATLRKDFHHELIWT